MTILQQHASTVSDRCACQPRFAPKLHEVDFLRITGKRLRKPPRGRSNPKKDRQKLKATKFTCFMSESQLQQLLQRTSSNGDDEEAMDITIIMDGVKMSK
jgi:hypothetical protein